MIDYFALLGEPRRPWLDPEQLKRKFLTLSAPCHPDRVHAKTAEEKEAAAARFMELNRAYQCLRESTSRTRHLWELESGDKAKSVQEVPAGLVGIFEKVFSTLRGAEEFLARGSGQTSAVGKAVRFRPAMDWVARLETVRQPVRARQQRLAEELEMMNRWWERAAADPLQRREQLPLERLEEISNTLSYLGRWEEKIAEKISLLSF